MESLLSDAPAPVCAGDGLRIFAYTDSMVRTVEVGGEPWFVAKDVAEILGYRSAPDMTRSLDEDEIGTTQIVRSTSGGNPNMTIISESGLYHAIFQSRKEEAKAFRRWVTGEVLPAIRRTGGYFADGGEIGRARQEAELLKAKAALYKSLESFMRSLRGVSRDGIVTKAAAAQVVSAVMEKEGISVVLETEVAENAVQCFVDDMLEHESGAGVSWRTLYKAFCAHAGYALNESGSPAEKDALTQRQFTAAMKSLFDIRGANGDAIFLDGHSVRGLKNYRLKTDDGAGNDNGTGGAA